MGIDVVEAERAVRAAGYGGSYENVKIRDYLGTVVYEFALGQIFSMVFSVRVDARTGVVM